MRFAGLIAGLGNPGKRYERTRHNIGFMVIDFLIASASGSRWPSPATRQKKKEYSLWEWPVGGASWLVTKPFTFMNLSGRAVRHVSSMHGLRAENILVVHDELDLPFGRMKLKHGGGLAGHNGLKSIASCLGSRDFRRLRIGIGRPPEGHEITKYVLSSFSREDMLNLPVVLEEAAHVLVAFCTEGYERALQRANSFKLSE
ncbi:MAG: aminoacyl-tRNA hydrolase [Desulfovibrionales bacterium]